jgi:hypothetical protein
MALQRTLEYPYSNMNFATILSIVIINEWIESIAEVTGI